MAGAGSTDIPSIESVKAGAVEYFKKHFGVTPTTAACAPGRVNLIGEHTDYNDGFVLPMALPQVTVVVGKRTDSGLCRVTTLAEGVDEPKHVEFPVPNKENSLHPGSPKWANYVKGVVAFFPGKYITHGDRTPDVSLPLGTALVSVRYIVLNNYLFLNNKASLWGRHGSSLCASANTPLGVYVKCTNNPTNQPTVCVHGMFIFCRSMDSRPVAMTDTKVAILVTNSNVKHELTGTEYPTRRKQCEEAATLMGKHSLREATITDIEGFKTSLDPESYRRIRHVVGEIARTEEAAVALENNDYKRFGELMVQSHNSLRDDYEVSCTELDKLVEAALEVDGVYGSRMTGGGFGGCTVTLLEKSSVEKAIDHIQKRYKGAATFYVCGPAAGATVLSV
ncbi:hypothetical protein ScPMuIL_004221 [Solemya velum]